MKDEIMVSVYCLAYNHEPYIRDALEGFVTQKVNFKYEVLVHDDASTDRTQEIIREYAQKYPEIIKPILQTENQYSKGVRILEDIIYPRMTGKYIAMCEGDDYWCSADKLQRQFDFLEAHPEYSACVHNTKVLNCRNGKTNLLNPSKRDKDLEFKKVVNYGNAEFQLSSLMCRREFYLVPEELRANGFGDYPMAVYLILRGKIRYLRDVMSVYRIFSVGSWTSRNLIDASQEKVIRTQKATTEFTTAMYQYCKKQHLSPKELDEVKKVDDRNRLMLYAMQYGLKGLLNDSERRKMFWHLDIWKKQWVVDTGLKQIMQKQNYGKKK